MKVLRWIGLVTLLVGAGAGAFFALVFLGMSSMAGDSPKTDGQAWPYLVMLGAALMALGAAFLVLNGLRLMVSGRFRAAALSLVPPAALAGLFVVWIRFS